MLRGVMLADNRKRAAYEEQQNPSQEYYQRLPDNVQPQQFQNFKNQVMENFYFPKERQNSQPKNLWSNGNGYPNKQQEPSSPLVVPNIGAHKSPSLQYLQNAARSPKQEDDKRSFQRRNISLAAQQQQNIPKIIFKKNLKERYQGQGEQARAYLHHSYSAEAHTAQSNHSASLQGKLPSKRGQEFLSMHEMSSEEVLARKEGINLKNINDQILQAQRQKFQRPHLAMTQTQPSPRANFGDQYPFADAATSQHRKNYSNFSEANTNALTNVFTEEQKRYNIQQSQQRQVPARYEAKNSIKESSVEDYQKQQQHQKSNSLRNKNQHIPMPEGQVIKIEIQGSPNKQSTAALNKKSMNRQQSLFERDPELFKILREQQNDSLGSVSPIQKLSAIKNQNPELLDNISARRLRTIQLSPKNMGYPKGSMSQRDIEPSTQRLGTNLLDRQLHQSNIMEKKIQNSLNSLEILLNKKAKSNLKARVTNVEY